MSYIWFCFGFSLCALGVSAVQKPLRLCGSKTSAPPRCEPVVVGSLVTDGKSNRVPRPLLCSGWHGARRFSVLQSYLIGNQAEAEPCCHLCLGEEVQAIANLTFWVKRRRLCFGVWPKMHPSELVRKRENRDRPPGSLERAINPLL